jgi:hypothetical protein
VLKIWLFEAIWVQGPSLCIVQWVVSCDKRIAVEGLCPKWQVQTRISLDRMFFMMFLTSHSRLVNKLRLV